MFSYRGDRHLRTCQEFTIKYISDRLILPLRTTSKKYENSVKYRNKDNGNNFAFKE